MKYSIFCFYLIGYILVDLCKILKAYLIAKLEF